MRSTLLSLASVSVLLIASHLTTAQAKIKIAAAPYATGATADIWIDLNGVAGVTSFRVTNSTSPKDTYPTRVLTAEEVSKGVLFIRVNVLKKDGASNIYYIDGFRMNKRLADSDYDPSNEVTIKSFESVATLDGSDDPPKPTPAPMTGGTPTTGGGGATTTPTPATKAKLRLQAQVLVTDASFVIVRVFRNGLPSSALGKYVVEVENKGTTIFPDTPIEAKDGKVKDYQDIAVSLKEGSNKVKIYPKVDDKPDKDATGEIDVLCSFCADAGSSASTRAIVGYEQIGASSSGSKQSPFLEFYFDSPLRIPLGNKKKHCGTNESGCVDGEPIRVSCIVGTSGCDENGTKNVRRHFTFSVWANVRLSSIPVQTLVGIGSASQEFNTFLNNNSSNSPNELTESFDFLLGLQSPRILDGVLGQGFFRGKTSLHLYLGVGGINPLSTEKTAQIFHVPKICTDKTSMCTPDETEAYKQFLGLFPEAQGKEYIAFVAPTRDKFFRQWFAGLRLKTSFFDGDKPSNKFPAMFDVGIGQNEAITQKLRGMVLRADGSTPLPIKGGVLSIFGSVQMKLGRQVNSAVRSLFLVPADSDITLTSPSVGVVTIGEYSKTVSNRDTFRLGIGIDLFKLFKIGNNDQ